MWFKNIFRRRPNKATHRRSKSAKTEGRRKGKGDEPLFDETFLRHLERLSLQAQRTLRGNPSHGEHPSLRYLPTSVFSDHRPYSSGDDLRYVDWNAYARHNLVLLKLGEAEQDVDVHLLLDASRSMAWGKGSSKLRTAQRLVGTLGYLALSHSDRLRVTAFGEQVLRPFGPAQGKGRLIEMLHYIEHVPIQEQTSLETVLQQCARSYPRGGLLVLCSDLLAPEGLAEGLQLLQPPRWQVLVLHLIDPQELRPDLQGPFELEDSETGKRLELSVNAETMEHYQRNLAGWQKWLMHACAQSGATYTRISTAWPLEKKIIPYLRARRMLE